MVDFWGLGKNCWGFFLLISLNNRFLIRPGDSFRNFHRFTHSSSDLLFSSFRSPGKPYLLVADVCRLVHRKVHPSGYLGGIVDRLHKNTQVIEDATDYSYGWISSEGNNLFASSVGRIRRIQLLDPLHKDGSALFDSKDWSTNFISLMIPRLTLSAKHAIYLNIRRNIEWVAGLCRECAAEPKPGISADRRLWSYVWGVTARVCQPRGIGGSADFSLLEV